MTDASSFEETLILQTIIIEKASKMFVLISEPELPELMCRTKLCDIRYNVRYRYVQKWEHTSKAAVFVPVSRFLE